MIKLTAGQKWVLGVAAAPMAAVGVAGAVATYVNMDNVLHRGASALGLVAAGEGATLICALVALAVTLMGQHTPTPVRLGMWLVPLAAAAVGVALAPTGAEAVVMAFTPLAMTAAGEGVAFVARRVVAYRTGVDIEQQRRSGLLLWHSNRVVNGGAVGKRLSHLAVWRLTRKFAETDNQLSVQLGSIQRFRISEGADANLAAVLGGTGEAPQGVLWGRERSGLGSGWVKAAAPKGLPRYVGAEGYRSAAEGTTVPFERIEIPAEQWDLRVANPEDYREAIDDHFDRVREILAADQGESDVEDAAPTLLTVADVATMRGVKPGTVRSWFHRGLLEKVMVDGKPYVRAADLADFRV